MAIRIGINGFGRIGRLVFRAAAKNPNVTVVGINDPFIDTDYMVYMLKYDTVHGRFDGDVSHDGSNLIVNGQKIATCAEKSPADIPWGKVGADYVVESTGVFLTAEKAQGHIDAGAKHVVMSAPSKDATPMFVMGVNHKKYDPSMKFVSNASCTTNCLAPAAKVVNDKWGIVKGLMTTVHSYTGDQRLVDLPHKDPRRARAAALNIIPTTTGAAKAVALVIPSLKGKFDGTTLRVPTPTVSIVDFVATLEKPCTTEELIAAFLEAEAGPLNGILGVSQEPLVSMDFKGDTRSSIIDAGSCMALDGDMVKVVAWYDNEWGYSTRVADLVVLMGDKGL